MEIILLFVVCGCAQLLVFAGAVLVRDAYGWNIHVWIWSWLVIMMAGLVIHFGVFQ